MTATTPILTAAERETLVNKWIQWLEDPTHKQVRGCLENAYGNCCLGGACRVLDAAHPGMLKIGPSDGVAGRVGFNRKDGTLPGTVIFAYGLRNSVGSGDDKDAISLSNFNDIYDYTFPQIAAVIRARWSTRNDSERGTFLSDAEYAKSMEAMDAKGSGM